MKNGLRLFMTIFLLYSGPVVKKNRKSYGIISGGMGKGRSASGKGM